MSTSLVATFNYGELDPEIAGVARTVAARIRSRLRAAYVETGSDLIRMKEHLGHGRFGAWLKAEFDMTERSAENYMNAARWLEGKSEAVSDLPAVAIYALAAPSAPAAAVHDVVTAVERGEKLATRTIREKLAEATKAAQAAEAEAAKSSEQRQKEARARTAKAARASRLERERQAWHEREKREEQDRRQQLAPIAARLTETFNADVHLLVGVLNDWRQNKTLVQLLKEAGQ